MNHEEVYIRFAVAALQGMLANPECDYRSYTLDTVTKEACDYADEMMKQVIERRGWDA